MKKQDYVKEWQEVRENTAAFLKGIPAFSDLPGMEGVDLSPVYKKAHDTFSLENYEEAETLFAGLCLMDAGNPAFQTGLAAALEAREKFREAVHVYVLAAVRDPRAHTFYRMGRCFMGLGDRERAVAMFEQAGGPGMETGAGLKERAYTEKSKKMVQLLTGGEGHDGN